MVDPFFGSVVITGREGVLLRRRLGPGKTRGSRRIWTACTTAIRIVGRLGSLIIAAIAAIASCAYLSRTGAVVKQISSWTGTPMAIHGAARKIAAHGPLRDWEEEQDMTAH